MLSIERVADPVGLTGQIADVYRSAFSVFHDGPDDEEVRMFSLDALPRHAAREAFRFIAAMEDESLVGFVYGYHGRDGEWWEEWLRSRIPEAVYQEWLRHQFNLTEFCVRRERQRQGIGARLYEELHRNVAAELPYERAVLTTRRGENPARSFYLSRGWQVVWDAVDDRYSLLGLKLR